MLRINEATSAFRFPDRRDPQRNSAPTKKLRLREAEKEKELVEQLSANFGIAPGAPKVKRVASSQLHAELERNKRMKIEWSKILNLVQGTKEMSDVYGNSACHLTSSTTRPWMNERA
jgi:hypothetical protein